MSSNATESKKAISATRTDEALVVLCTTASKDDAKMLAHELIGDKLAACVTLNPEVTSIYSWKGAIEEETECLMIIKTRRKRFSALKRRIIELHSYDVPEIIAIPVVDGNRDYLKWLREQT